MVSRSANIGRKRTAPIEVSSAKSSKPSRSAKDDTYSNNDIAAGSMAPKRATAATSESKSTKRQSATKPTSKSVTSSTSKRPAEDETVSQPAKRQRSTKTEKAAPSAPKKVVRKPAPKKAPTTKETKTTKTKTKITSESELNGIKHQKIQAAKKSPVETRKIEPEINAPPTEKLRVFACGEGSAGELGLGPKGREVKRPRYNVLLDPEKIGIVQMSAGGMHTVALTHDNKILTWGVNDQGALGRDTTWEGGLRDVDDGSDSESDDEDLNPKESTPLPVDASHFPKDTKFVQVAAGDSCSFVLTTTGYVYGWGTFRDGNGIFGFTLDSKKEIVKQVNTPILIPNLKNIVQISAGADFALALDKSGDVYGWGNGQQDQLGRRLVDRRRHESLVPTRMALPKKKIVHVFAGSNHAFAIDKDKNVWAWGLNNFAQTGINIDVGESGSTVTAPTKVSSFHGVHMKLLAGGSHHSIGVSEDGKCYVWGRMDSHQMGIAMSSLQLNDPEKVLLDEREKPRILLEPTPIPNLLFSHAAAGSDHNVAITVDGKAYSWGFSTTYQCGQGDEDEVPVATLIDNTALRNKKMVWAGAGGQYSVFAADLEDVPMTNGA